MINITEDGYYQRLNHKEGKVFIESIKIDIDSKNPLLLTVFLEPVYVGVCSSDLKEIQGKRITRRDFGHECLAKVVASEAKSFSRGEYVIIDPHIPVSRETAFAELMYVTAEEKELDKSLLKVKSNSKGYVLTEPLACVIHACKKLRIKKEDNILIIGAGFFGYLFYHYLAHHKYTCQITNRTEGRLYELEREVQAINKITIADAKKNKYNKSIFSGSELDYDFLEECVDCMEINSEVLIFSPVKKNIEMSIYNIRNQELRRGMLIKNTPLVLIGSLGAIKEDFIAAIDILGKPEFEHKIEKILSPPLNFEEGLVRINELVRSSMCTKKTIIRPGRESRKRIEFILKLNHFKNTRVKNSKRIDVSKLSPENVKNIISIYVKTARKWGWSSRLHWVEKQWLKLADEERYFIYLVINKKNESLGFFEFHKRGKNEIIIKYMALLDEYIGQKFGSEILQRIIEMATVMRVDDIYVTTRSTDHENALENYLKNGFRLNSFYKVH